MQGSPFPQSFPSSLPPSHYPSFLHWPLTCLPPSSYCLSQCIWAAPAVQAKGAEVSEPSQASPPVRLLLLQPFGCYSPQFSANTGASFHLSLCPLAGTCRTRPGSAAGRGATRRSRACGRARAGGHRAGGPRPGRGRACPGAGRGQRGLYSRHGCAEFAQGWDRP